MFKIIQQPINYLSGMTYWNQILLVAGFFFALGIIYPVILHIVKTIEVLCHPIMFPYKHVLITGAGSGLGKELVQKIYMKGAFITMVGRDPIKLEKTAEFIDVSTSYYKIKKWAKVKIFGNKFFNFDIKA